MARNRQSSRISILVETFPSCLHPAEMHRWAQLGVLACLWLAAPCAAWTVCVPVSHAAEGPLHARDITERPVHATRRHRGARIIMRGYSGRGVRRGENVAGEIFVDATCINCDTCRWMAPGTFAFVNGASAVHSQPDGDAELFQALQAVAACPTGSIRTENPQPRMKDARDSFPRLMPEVSSGGVCVYHCGFHSRKSFGGASYFVAGGAGGNVLVDSPRYFKPLAQRLRALGGVDFMFLSHRDDVADHAKWKEAFPAMQRVIHAHEADAAPGAERVLVGTGPWNMAGGGDGDGYISFQPGHTAGHLVLQYHGVLFTGDHLAVTRQLGALAAFRRFCWFDWDTQIESVGALIADRQRDFRAILPAHGRALICASNREMETHLRQCLAWMESAA